MCFSACMHMGNGDWKKIHPPLSKRFKLHRGFFHTLQCSSNQIGRWPTVLIVQAYIGILPLLKKNFNRSNGKGIQKKNSELHFSTTFWNCSNFPQNGKNGYIQFSKRLINYHCYCSFLSLVMGTTKEQLSQYKWKIREMEF